MLAVLVIGTIHSPLPAQVNPGWIGKRVVPKSSKLTLLVNGELLDRGEEDVEFYRVEKIDGTSLLLKAEVNHTSGWAEQDQVIPLDDAVEFFTRQIRAHPGDVFLRTARAVVSTAKKEYASALRDYDEAVRLDPKGAFHYRGRGQVWQLKKEYDKAISDFNEAIKLDPKSAQAFIGRGSSWLNKRDFSKAIDDASEAIWLDPLAITAYEIRGLGWSAKKEFAKAIIDYTTVLRLDSRHVQSYCNRGDAWSALSKYDKAMADFNEALQIDEGCARAHGCRAWLLATCPNGRYRDGQKAVASATRACELTGWNDLVSLEALAASCAESGDFDAAIRWQTRANLLRHGDADRLIGEARLRSFQQRKPWRAPSV